MAAADQLGVSIVVVRRGSATDGVETVPDAAAAVEWLRRRG
jgi:precorrin-6A/cobalt-precorrin-6A reductase